MEYKYLKDEEQAAMLQQRLAQYEREHYNHEINKKLLQASGATDDATERAIAEADNAMIIIEAAHANTVQEFAKIDGALKAKSEAAKQLVADNASVPVNPKPKP